ncbi:hypothetical protein LWI29_015395 [Acer saccharum]|uniref:ENTH domain-containing protein n=1 Tax=Acer saccharum TaxID=4024 RepID=A0AA39RDZ1_ACESA|nr:hypothetical protein LWI29_015395 [Acer saccharum]
MNTRSSNNYKWSELSGKYGANKSEASGNSSIPTDDKLGKQKVAKNSSVKEKISVKGKSVNPGNGSCSRFDILNKDVEDMLAGEERQVSNKVSIGPDIDEKNALVEITNQGKDVISNSSLRGKNVGKIGGEKTRIMAAGNPQQSLRKALGVLKDSTKVGLVNFNSDNKATNHDEVLPKEKHIKTILDAVSASKPRADVAYCIQGLAKRLAKTHNWTVALKTLIVIHRSSREVGPTFCQELINYSHGRALMLNLSHFRDDSSPIAWDYSAWVRTYALCLEERVECYRILKYDIIEKLCWKEKRLDIPDFLEHLPPLQQLFFRLLDCKAESLSELFEICRGLDFGRGQKYIKIEQVSAGRCIPLKEAAKVVAIPEADLMSRQNHSLICFLRDNIRMQAVIMDSLYNDTVAIATTRGGDLLTFLSLLVAPPTNVQMAAMAKQRSRIKIHPVLMLSSRFCRLRIPTLV